MKPTEFTICVFVNTDNKSYLAKTPEIFLQEVAREKKKIYLEACLQKRHHYLPFIDSVDALLGLESAATLKRVASLLVAHWHQT